MDVSIITCTYNPNPKIFERVLRSIESLDFGSLQVEYVIVDNNSTPPVSEMPIVQSFLERNPWARVIVEKEQGLSFARIAGTKATSGRIIVFVDDDNEIDSCYLKEVMNLFSNYPFVGVWGSGHISVEFPESAPLWIEKEMKPFYLERKRHRTEYTTVVEMSCPAYPVGGGMALKREIMEHYAFLVKKHNFKTTDRKAGSGASWGDTQINWLSIKNGYAVGVSPNLKFQHLISKKRASLEYILRLSYEGTATGLTAFYEIFPEYQKEFDDRSWLKQNPFSLSFLVILFGHLIRLQFRKAKIYVALRFGMLEAYYRAFNVPRTKTYQIISSFFLNFIKL